MPNGVLTPHVCTLGVVARPPINMSGNFVCTLLCKVTFKHLHQPLRSHMQSLEP